MLFENNAVVLNALFESAHEYAELVVEIALVCGFAECLNLRKKRLEYALAYVSGRDVCCNKTLDRCYTLFARQRAQFATLDGSHVVIKSLNPDVFDRVLNLFQNNAAKFHIFGNDVC